MNNTGEALSSLERQEEILQLLMRQPRLSIATICKQFDISEATARRDLETLSGQGKLQRVHGGAIAIRHAPPELPLLERSSEQAREKACIGQAASRLVQEGETIFLGSGTTVLEAARCLRGRRNLTVITNSLQVINALADSPDITLVSLGGVLRASELSFIGHITEQALSEVRADRVIIGIRALSIENGLTNDYLPETMTDRAILRIGRQVIVLADHTKHHRVAAAFLAPLKNIHLLITDSQASPAFIDSVRQQGVDVLIAN